MNPNHEREKIVNIEERIPKIKEQRKQKANRRLISFILLFFMMVLIIVYLQMPISKVSSVSVSGNENVSAKEVAALSDIHNGQTEFWSLNKKKTEEKIEQNKLVKKAAITKAFPNKVNISIEEYKTIAYLQKNDVYYEVLENGTVLPSEVTPDDAGPILVNWTNGKKRIRMAKELEKLSGSLKQSISEIYYTPAKMDNDRIKLYMNDGYVVTASIKTFASKMKTYPSIISQLDGKKGIIHLEVATYFEEFNKGNADKKKGN
ncbi:dihydropteridine reductase [Bacillus nakamurai]|uniref:Cell division protein DivIB n=1 Tax=Bacillus nakamurai TaxID=1793963 RepID=A0A150FC56_9BACI|nr:cell division protein FtsQ/DivIB [Bacillus nakamurai]KXZ14858.1 dihydropteridine reductase [Bacillus nakamurai]KXZ22078.1 dihydropteridine reductase [Bacillus nakamurai]MCC9023285.1 cell division protein FtsQ/DivIB [Bacillus nakamurai]MCP6683413.1 cell division protein FtsQ/DivIB [Bacillus nakamurai]MED1228711.1 cell division protein FtsQ/DivIB [Bacillus nakamurai]